jgi:hypothetical protein
MSLRCFGIHSRVQFIHYGALIDCRVNTNEWRKALHYVKRRLKSFRKTPLMELGTDIYGDPWNAARWARIPMETLLAAFGHVEARLERLRSYPSTGRVRKHEKWLGKWQRQICVEIDRRRA